MVDSFALHLFFPDGGPPESRTFSIAGLVPRWVSTCQNLLDEHGPVLNQSLGDTLSHLSIQMAGPIGHFKVLEHAQYDVALSLGRESEQDQATINWFSTRLTAATNAASYRVDQAAERVLARSASTPTLLLLDWCRPDVDEDDKAALFQLCVHFAGAYLASMPDVMSGGDG